MVHTRHTKETESNSPLQLISIDHSGSKKTRINPQDREEHESGHIDVARKERLEEKVVGTRLRPRTGPTRAYNYVYGDSTDEEMMPSHFRRGSRRRQQQNVTEEKDELEEEEENEKGETSEYYSSSHNGRIMRRRRPRIENALSSDEEEEAEAMEGKSRHSLRSLVHQRRQQDQHNNDREEEDGESEDQDEMDEEDDDDFNNSAVRRSSRIRNRPTRFRVASASGRTRNMDARNHHEEPSTSGNVPGRVLRRKRSRGEPSNDQNEDLNDDLYSRVKRSKRRDSDNQNTSNSEDGGTHRTSYDLRAHKPMTERYVAPAIRSKKRPEKSVFSRGTPPRKIPSKRSYRSPAQRRSSTGKREVFYGSSSSTSSDEGTNSNNDDEHRFLHRKEKSMAKAKSRICPLNMTSPVVVKDRVRTGASLADVDPMEIDRSVTFDSVGGLQKHIRTLKEMVVFPLLYPEVYERFKVTPSRGVLFYGPPGTGKTLVARALANECSRGAQRVAFFMRKGADCLSKWVGEAERQLRLLFDKAYEMRPSIIFFDEIDGLAPVRSSRQDQIHSSIVSTLLALMDGIDSRGEIVVMGATNRIDSIDPALRRPGRFDKEFHFPLPNLEDRKTIMKIHTKNWDPPLRDEFLTELAERCAGYCGADIKCLVTEATQNALRRRYPQIYSTSDKLQLDVSSIVLAARDFGQAIANIIPASQRAVPHPALALDTCIRPLLIRQLTQIQSALQSKFPYAKPNFLQTVSTQILKTPAATENGNGEMNPLDMDLASDEDESMPSIFQSGGLSSALHRSFLARTTSSSSCPRVFRPRLLITGPAGQGQTVHLAPAALHLMEHLPVHTLNSPTLFASSAKLPEEACANVFHEAKRTAPSIIYMPYLNELWGVLTDSLRVTFLTLVHGLNPSTPILLFATCETEIADLDDQIKSLFSLPGGEIMSVNGTTADERKQFFSDLILNHPCIPPPTHRKAGDRIVENVHLFIDDKPSTKDIPIPSLHDQIQNNFKVPNQRLKSSLKKTKKPQNENVNGNNSYTCTFNKEEVKIIQQRRNSNGDRSYVREKMNLRILSLVTNNISYLNQSCNSNSTPSTSSTSSSRWNLRSSKSSIYLLRKPRKRSTIKAPSNPVMTCIKNIPRVTKKKSPSVSRIRQPVVVGSKMLEISKDVSKLISKMDQQTSSTSLKSDLLSNKTLKSKSLRKCGPTTSCLKKKSFLKSNPEDKDVEGELKGVVAENDLWNYNNNGSIVKSNVCKNIAAAAPAYSLSFVKLYPCKHSPYNKKPEALQFIQSLGKPLASKEILEPLVKAPPPEPRKLTEREERKLLEQENDTLRELRIFLRDILSKLGREIKFRIFAKPVDVEEVPDYYDIVKKPMDLSTMMANIDLHKYNTASAFVQDIDLICNNALEYNPDQGPTDRAIRHRACALRDMAHALMKAELDKDFEKLCHEIEESRKRRGVDSSKNIPDFYYTRPLNSSSNAPRSSSLSNVNHRDHSSFPPSSSAHPPHQAVPEGCRYSRRVRGLEVPANFSALNRIKRLSEKASPSSEKKSSWHQEDESGSEEDLECEQSKDEKNEQILSWNKEQRLSTSSLNHDGQTCQESNNRAQRLSPVLRSNDNSDRAIQSQGKKVFMLTKATESRRKYLVNRKKQCPWLTTRRRKNRSFSRPRRTEEDFDCRHNASAPLDANSSCSLSPEVRVVSLSPTKKSGTVDLGAECRRSPFHHRSSSPPPSYTHLDRPRERRRSSSHREHSPETAANPANVKPLSSSLRRTRRSSHFNEAASVHPDNNNQIELPNNTSDKFSAVEDVDKSRLETDQPESKRLTNDSDKNQCQDVNEGVKSSSDSSIKRALEPALMALVTADSGISSESNGDSRDSLDHNNHNNSNSKTSTVINHDQYKNGEQSNSLRVENSSSTFCETHISTNDRPSSQNQESSLVSKNLQSSTFIIETPSITEFLPPCQSSTTDKDSLPSSNVSNSNNAAQLASLEARAKAVLAQETQQIKVDKTQLVRLLDCVVEKTQGLTVENLQQMYSMLSCAIFNHRHNYDKQSLVQEMYECVNGFCC